MVSDPSFSAEIRSVLPLSGSGFEFENRRRATYREFESLLLRRRKPIEIHGLRGLRVEVREMPGGTGFLCGR
jgi:hypothetical protein